MNPTKSPEFDPTRIGKRSHAELDAGFEAMTGLRPSDEPRPLNPKELEDLCALETDDLTVNEVLRRMEITAASIRTRLQIALQRNNETLADIERRFLNEVIPIGSAIRAGDFALVGYALLIRTRESYVWSLRHQIMADELSPSRAEGDANPWTASAELDRKQGQRVLKQDAVMAKAHLAKNEVG